MSNANVSEKISRTFVRCYCRVCIADTGTPTEDGRLTLESPVRVPRVGDQPIRSSVLGAPSENLDGVSSQHLATVVLVYT